MDRAPPTCAAFRNTVRDHHDDAANLPRRSDRAGVPWATSALRTMRLHGPAAAPLAADIALVSGASATIAENTLEAVRTGRGPLSTGRKLFATAGILVLGGGDVLVKDNRVYRAGTNIVAGAPVPIPSGPVAGTTAITGNTALSGFVGIEVGSTGATVSDNQVHGNAVGLYAQGGSSGNTFDGNDARSNLQVDCEDDSSPIANTWTDNRAFTSQPSTICLVP